MVFDRPIQQAIQIIQRSVVATTEEVCSVVQRAAVAGIVPEPAFPLMWEPGAATGRFSADKPRYYAAVNYLQLS